MLHEFVSLSLSNLTLWLLLFACYWADIVHLHALHEHFFFAFIPGWIVPNQLPSCYLSLS